MNGKTTKVVFAVDANQQSPLLGLQDCIRLNLVKRIDQLSSKNITLKCIDDVVSENPSVVEGLWSIM